MHLNVCSYSEYSVTFPLQAEYFIWLPMV